ncbi:hypothetical protein [Streptomyces sp. KS 21]|uniref:hypothetical protein n=1 Tax=Streptomyces sp. KS 21 TaxID=2485150 RepID=UPI001062FDFA|nr:hypothetical protein [Streptomyces sp. KS 21]TDU73645.1 hypothetical protein EDD91_0227 [Streptomyces sp. KS 21]
MPVLNWRRAATAVSSAVLLATGIMAVPAASAEAAPARDCYSRNGFPTKGGNNIGDTPPRYKFSNSPYIGARYDSCENAITVYFGGTSRTDTTHYTMHWSGDAGGWHDQKMHNGAHRMWTIEAPGNDYNFLVQACNGNACTRWSPQIYVNAR